MRPTGLVGADLAVKPPAVGAGSGGGVAAAHATGTGATRSEARAARDGVRMADARRSNGRTVDRQAVQEGKVRAQNDA
jgi:hypothetical protein